MLNGAGCVLNDALDIVHGACRKVWELQGLLHGVYVVYEVRNVQCKMHVRLARRRVGYIVHPSFVVAALCMMHALSSMHSAR